MADMTAMQATPIGSTAGRSPDSSEVPTDLLVCSSEVVPQEDVLLRARA